MSSDLWPALLTESQAANYLGVGIGMLKRMRQREDIKSVRVGERTIRYRRKDLDKFIDSLPYGVGNFGGSNDDPE